MKLRFVPVDWQEDAHLHVLYNLLSERQPHQSISHKGMPAWIDHVKFVRSDPYKRWYLVSDQAIPDYVGAVYLTDKNEIGIAIFSHQHGKGYGKAAVQKLMEEYTPPFYANINPDNEASIAFFRYLGFVYHSDLYDPMTGNRIQVTYVYR